MSLVIAATIPSEVAARKLGEWLGKMVHRVQIVPRQGQWAIVVPEATLSRARRALREVIVAANPGNGTRECCKKLGKGAPCARCGRHAHFTVGWILPSRTSDERPACCAMCASALKRASANNPLTKMESKVLLTGALEHLQDHKRWQRMSPGTMLEEAGRAQGMASSVALYGSRRYRRVAKRVEGRGHRIGGSIRTRLAEVLPDSRSQPIMNPSIVLEWNQMTTKRREVLIRAAGFDPYAAENFSTRRWMQLPKIIQNRLMDSWESGTRRREAYATTRRMVRANPGRYLIQGLRPKHRNWVTLDYSDDEQRALLNALRRARLGDVTYRVWDTERVEEIWRGTGREATIEGWKATRPSGLVGANRRATMRRNPGVCQNPICTGSATNPRHRHHRPKGVTIYCRMCGEWARWKGPYKAATGAGWMTGKLACYACRQGLAALKRAKYDFKRQRMPGKKVSRNSSTVADNARIQHDQIVEAFLAGRPKKVGPRYWTDGKLLRVWGNLVAAKVPGGIELYDAGYRTLLTKNVLNTVLSHLGHGTIWQQARKWYIGTPGGGKAAWTGSWTIPTGGAAANRRRVRRNGRGENLTISDIGQWIDNDEGLYNWWRGSRQSKSTFIRENRSELEASIQRVLNRPPAQKTWRDYAGMNPRVRAWNIVAITPGRGRETMQSGHKDKKKAHDIAKLYQKIAKKEGRRTRYAVEPFRYSDTASRMRSRRNSPEGWVVTQDGETLKTFGSSQHDANRAWTWLHHHQTKSVERAIREEGYDVVYVRNGKVGYSMKQDFLSKKNPLTRGESATLLRQAKMHVTTARHDRSAKKHGIASYAAGRAQGKASAVRQFGPRGARRAAWKVLDRAARTNPHAGLNGLMNNCDAKKAMTFA